MRNPLRDSGPLAEATNAVIVFAVSVVVLVVNVVDGFAAFNLQFFLGAVFTGLVSFAAICWEVRRWARIRRGHKRPGY